MSVTAFIRRCLDSGMPLDMALAAGDAFEVEAPVFVPADSGRREKQRARQARYEERKRQKASEIVSLTSGASDDAKEAPPEPPKKTTPFPPLKGGTSPAEAAEPDETEDELPPEKPLTDYASVIWDLAPSTARRRSSRADVERALKAAAKRGRAPADVVAGLRAYYRSDDARAEGGRFAKGPHVMIRNERWEGFEPEPDPVSQVAPDPWAQRLLRWRTSAYWNSEWGPKPGKPGYRGPEAEGIAA